MEFTNVEDTSLQKVEKVNGNADELNFDDELGDVNPTVIKVIGCGGGGSSAVQRMIEDGVEGVQFIVLNTDKQALHQSSAKLRVPIGQKITGGLGAGGNPDVGEQAAIEDIERIQKILSNTNMVVVTAGMGGGTGTGSAPVVAELAKKSGILTIAVVTTPFEFEGKIRIDNAMRGLEKLRPNVDSLIVLPNDQIFKAVENVNRQLTFKEQFKCADGLLCAGVKGLTELITKPGEISLDFADVSTVMRGSGESILGVGKGKGKNRIDEAVAGAIANPLLENRQIDGARKILINAATNGHFSLEDSKEMTEKITNTASKDANIIFGLSLNEEMEDDELLLTVIATDFDDVDNDALQDPCEVKEITDIADYGRFEEVLGVDKKDDSSLPKNITKNHFGFNSEKKSDSFGKKNFPTNIDLNDKDQPAIFRKHIEGLSHSIDLTKL